MIVDILMMYFVIDIKIVFNVWFLWIIYLIKINNVVDCI